MPTLFRHRDGAALVRRVHGLEACVRKFRVAVYSLPRLATLAVIVIVAVSSTYSTLERGAAGHLAVSLRPLSAESNLDYVVRAAPAHDVLHRGDAVRFVAPDELAAYQYQALPVGSVLTLERTSPGPPQAVREPVVARSSDDRVIGWAVLALKLLFLGIAALVVARGGNDGSIQLAWLFVFIVSVVSPTAATWPWSLVLLYAIVGAPFVAIGFACAVDFATRFAGDPNAAWGRRVRRVSLVIVCCGIVAGTAISASSFFVPSTPEWLGWTVYAFVVVQALLFLVALGFAYSRARPSERQKALWVSTSLGAGVCGLVAGVLMQAAGIAEPWRDLPALLLIAMPVGCAYAILRYRLLDIGFVVNRATVFGVTSLVVLAALALVDFGLQNWLGSWLVRTGLTVQLVLALGIGIATRPLHHRVDTFVDDLFFRKRHEAEAALRAFARDVAYIDDPAVIAERTVATIARHADVRTALFLAADGAFVLARSSGSVPDARTVERNDPAIVRLSATRVHVDLHGLQSAFEGDYAFPMFARGRLSGLVVCGDKLDGVVAYAPDELEAITAVVTGASFALDLLRIERLENDLVELRAKQLLPR